MVSSSNSLRKQNVLLSVVHRQEPDSRRIPNHSSAPPDRPSAPPDRPSETNVHRVVSLPLHLDEAAPRHRVTARPATDETDVRRVVSLPLHLDEAVTTVADVGKEPLKATPLIEGAEKSP